jgi:hypothetical protein
LSTRCAKPSMPTRSILDHWRDYDDPAHALPELLNVSKIQNLQNRTVVDCEILSGDRVSESSESIRARVQAARDIQNMRFSGNGSSDIVCNADMRVGEIRQFCRLQDEGQSMMRAATSCCA